MARRPEETSGGKQLIDRDVFWTGLRDAPAEAPAAGGDDWLQDFLDDTREEAKPPRPPKPLESFRRAIRGFEGLRPKVALREDLYEECYPRVGRGELARVDDASGSITRRATDVDAYEVAPEKKKRRRGRKGDAGGKVVASMRERYDEEIGDDDN